MKYYFTLLVLFVALASNVACNGNDQRVVLKKCTTLGDESIAYARANYVKLFHYYNPEKFVTSYEKVKNFDNETHRNIINTYDIAVRKIKKKDAVSEALLTSCKNLATFSKNFVDQTYPRAISFESKENPLSDKFFMQINHIVKFDDSIGLFDPRQLSFKQLVAAFKVAEKKYQETFKKSLAQD